MHPLANSNYRQTLIPQPPPPEKLSDLRIQNLGNMTRQLLLNPKFRQRIYPASPLHVYM